MSPTFSSHLLSSLFYLLLSLSSGNDAAKDLIHAVCKDASKDTKYMTYEFCVAALRRAAPKSQNASFKGLGFIALKLDKTNMIRLKSYTKNLLLHYTNKFEYDLYVKEALKDCVELYLDEIDSLKVATMAYNVGDYGTANAEMSTAYDSVLDCEDGFINDEKKGGVVSSPLKKMNQAMVSFNELALYFTYELSQVGYRPRHALLDYE